MTPSLLVIDDDPVLLRLIASALNEYEVVEASSGEEGLRMFASRPFDLVVCDLVMPGVSGLDAIHELRRQRPSQRIMVVSAYGSQENLLATLRERVIDFMVKPFTPEHLRTTVKNLLAGGAAIEVISANPRWIELRLPASFQVAASLSDFLATLQADIDETTREKASIAFRELINNAIEHGCKGDPEGMVVVSCVRMTRGILYRIQDPGRGFDLGAIPHAAVAYPEGEAPRHFEVREQAGMRPGRLRFAVAQESGG